MAQEGEKSDCEKKHSIFHDILRSDLPQSEKASSRLKKEAFALLAARTRTTASTLALTANLRSISHLAYLQRLIQRLYIFIRSRVKPEYLRAQLVFGGSWRLSTLQHLDDLFFSDVRS